MSEMNLIPEEYQEGVWKIEFAKKWVWLLSCLLFLFLVMFGGIEWEIKKLKTEVKTLEAQKTKWVEENNQYQQLLEQRKRLQYLRGSLAQLQEGPLSEQVFVTLDRALEVGKIWFSKLEFQREIQLPTTPQAIPEQEMKLTVKNAVTIQGQATDHAALAQFIKELFAQPRVANVLMNQTSTGQGSSRSFIDFDLTLVLKPIEGVTPHE